MTEHLFKRLSVLDPRIRKKIQLQGHSEIGSCWIWKGSVTGPRHTRAWAKPGTVHRNDERAGSFKRPLPTIWSREHGYPVAAHRKIYCELAGIAYADMPEIRRCAHDLCVNPHHLSVRGAHRKPGTVVPDLTKAIAARTAESREAIWQRLITVQPMPGLSAQTMADECGLTEITQDLLEEYEKWYVAHPELIKDAEDDLTYDEEN